MSFLQPALHDFATAGQREWSHDRSQTIGASEIGQCARKVFWLKNENDPRHAASRDPGYVDGWGARVRGSTFENHFWEPALRQAYGARLLYAGPEQKTFVHGFLSATPDGLLIGLKPDEVVPGSGTEVCVECKTADPRTNLTEAKAENVYQTHVQMGLLRELTEFRPTHSVLSYTDASFWNEGKEFVVAFDEGIYNAAKARAAHIMTATDASELKPEGWIAGGRECNHCPFTRACGIQRKSVPEGNGSADPQFVAEISDLARAAKQLELTGKENDSRLREIQQEIRDRLRSKDLRRLVGHGVSVTWSAVKGRQSYDHKAIREAAEQAGVDIEQFSTIGEPTDRLVITVSKSDEDEEKHPGCGLTFNQRHEDKMNDLAIQEHGTSVAVAGGNYFQSYGEQVSQKSIVGKLLKFSKGDYLVGEDNEEVAEGTQYVANMDELMVGWIRWEDGKPTDQIMGRVAEGYQAPKRNTLGDDDKSKWEVDEQGRERDPWQFSNYLILKSPDGKDEDSLFTFTTSSRGGLNAIGELCKAYGKAMRQRPDEFPIVALKVGSYQHSNKAYGRIKFPIFEVVGWSAKSEMTEALAGEAPAEDAPATTKKAGKGAAQTRF